MSLFIPRSSLNLSLTLTFVGIIVASELILKPIAILTNRDRWRNLDRRQRWMYLISWAVALRTVQRAEIATNQTRLRLLSRATFFTALLVIYYLAFWKLYYRHVQVQFWEGYFGVPAAYLLGEGFGAWSQLWSTVTGYTLPPHHEKPWASESIRDFWGHRWNTWVSDAFREFFLDRLPTKAFYYVAVIFILSAIYHEFLINIPYLLLTHRNLFGSMLIYFIFQIIGLYLERSSFWPGTRSNRLFMLMVVVLPAPLIINEALLHIIELWPH